MEDSRSDEEGIGTIRRRMATGTAWMLAARVFDRLIGLLSISILARLLDPSDFGLLALAWVAIGLIRMLSAFGPGAAVIRDQNAKPWHYDTAWTLRIVRGVVIVCILLIISAPTAVYFNEPRIEGIIYCLSISVAIESFVNIGVIDFRKHLRFDREVTYTLAVRFSSAAFTVLIVALWPSYWSLVAGAIARSFIRLTLSYALHDFRPKLSVRGISSIFEFSKWVFVSNTISSISNRLPVLVLGRAVGVDLLAIFTLAQEISTISTRDLQAPVRRVLFPGFSILASTPDLLVRTFIDSFSLTLLIGLPLSAGIVILAPDIVLLILGEKWIAAIPILKILGIGGVIQSFMVGSQPIYLATNRPQINALLAGLKILMLAPALVLGVHWAGVFGAAWALLFVSIIVLVLDLTVISRSLNIPVRSVLSMVWRIVVATSIMGPAVYFIRKSALTDDLTSDPMVFAGLVATGIVFYFIVLFSLWRISGRPSGPETTLLEAFMRLLNKIPKRSFKQEPRAKS